MNSSGVSNKLQYVKDPRGDLTEVDFVRDLHSNLRGFFVKGVPSSKIRGEHAHKDAINALSV